MTRLEAKQRLARKLNISLTSIALNKLFNETDLNDFVQTGLNLAWDLAPWSFAEGDWKTTTTDTPYFDFPEDCEEESIERITVGGEVFRRISFADYQKHFEDDSSSTEKIFAVHKRFIFVNQNAYSVGDELVVFGKDRAPTLDDDADLLPFSPSTDNQETSGNGAIVLLAYAEALGSEKMKNYSESDRQHEKGLKILTSLAKQTARRRAMDQRSQPVFDVPNYFPNGREGFTPGNF